MDVRYEGNGFETLDLRMRQLQGYEGRTGFFEDAKYPKGFQVAGNAAVHEFGLPSKNIPPRPFFRPAIRKNEVKWRKFATQLVQRILDGKLLAQDGMEALAEFAAEDVKQSINDVWSPKLKERTLAARRAKGNFSEKPLIDTKLLIRSVQGRAIKE